jgi:hypothetical protein
MVRGDISLDRPFELFHLPAMKIRTKKLKATPIVLDSPTSVERFKKLASKFTKKTTSSKKSAIKALSREGILTSKGNLTKRYSAK